MYLGGNNGIQPFVYSAGDDVAAKWTAWVQQFEFFMSAMPDADGQLDWHALMLHYGGPTVQQVHLSLDADTAQDIQCGPLAAGMVTPYVALAKRLTAYFAPKRNPTYERCVFKMMKQLADEKIDTFILRLRQQAAKCGFGDRFDEFMKDQITACCSSKELRKKILRSKDCSLDDVINMARIEETVEEEDKIFREERVVVNTPSNEVNKIQHNKRRFGQVNKWQSKPDQKASCGRCGRFGHNGGDKCPAKEKKCLKCNAIGHFAKKCFSKKRSAERGVDDSQMAKQIKTTENVQWVSTPPNGNVTDEEYVLCIDDDDTNDDIVECVLGGVVLNGTIDSGSKYNLINEKTWTWLKSSNVRVHNQRRDTDKSFKAYNGGKLTVIGMFDASISVGKVGTNATFYIIANGGPFLLGKITSKKLGILRLGTNVNSVQESSTFPKIKGIQVDLPIKLDVKPVVQAYRRVPIAVEQAVNDKIDKMIAQDIVEKVTGPSKWISPLVVVPRNNSDEIRICVDMRRANEAVERENHPMPTFEDFLPHLNKAKMFSKIDVKNAFHQVV